MKDITKSQSIFSFLRFPPIYLLIFIFVFSLGCERSKPPIKIGLAGGLTGRHADLGINGRNGALYAVDEINRSGGINGRTVELISKDDKQDPDVARQVDREL